MDEIWEGDDEEAELPVLGPTSEPKRRRRTRPAPRPKGIPLESAPDARRQVLAEATGKAYQEPEEWREQMSNGRRDRAISALESGGRRGSGSGFGLA